MKFNSLALRHSFNAQNPRQEEESRFTLRNCLLVLFAILTFGTAMMYPFAWKKEAAEKADIMANATPLELDAAFPAVTGSVCLDGKLFFVTKDQAFFAPYTEKTSGQKTPLKCK